MENQESKGYNDERWKKKRMRILQRDNYQCQCCKKPAQDVHHINYRDKDYIPVGNDVWHSPDENLVSLCKKCHNMFKGSISESIIFIPAKHPICVYKEIECISKEYELENPVWEEVVPELRSMQMKYGYIEKAIILSVLAPESTYIGRQILLNKPHEGLNELELYKLYERYGTNVSFKLRELKELSVRCPSTKKNCDYFIKELSLLLEESKRKPTSGIIEIASRSKRKGYYIALFDIAKDSIVNFYDLSGSIEYRESEGKDHNRLAQFYAVKYVMDRCNKTGEEVSSLPIFPNDSNGDIPLIEDRINEYKIEVSSKPQGIFRLIKEKMDEIDFSKDYLYFDWNRSDWGDIPTKRLREKRLTVKDVQEIA